MEIKKSKETLVLTQKEKDILNEAHNILDKIFQASEVNGDLEILSEDARDKIVAILKDAEIKM